MNISDKILAIFLTLVLYVVHFGIIWGLYRFNLSKTLSDLRRFGAEFAFLGVSFFGAALLDTSSEYYNYIYTGEDSIKNLVVVTVFSILIFFVFDGVAVWLFKTYEEQLRSHKTQAQRWRLWLSHALGIVVLCVGVVVL